MCNLHIKPHMHPHVIYALYTARTLKYAFKNLGFNQCLRDGNWKLLIFFLFFNSCLAVSYFWSLDNIYRLTFDEIYNGVIDC
jgi:hypothetical protein